MVLQRNPVMSAIYLIANFFCIAALYLMLRAQFLAVIQIIVYAGAIMVLVVFVIMLLNLGDEEQLTEKVGAKKIVGALLAAAFLMQLLYLFGFMGDGEGRGFHPDAADLGTVQRIGSEMFERFIVPFEVTGMLLLAAIVGAVILAKKRI